MTVMNVESIAIELIIPTPDNPRTVKPTDPAVIEMAATMRPPGGQLQPGVARPHPTLKGRYDLRAGARRLAAAKLAGLDRFAINILDLTDEQAMKVTVLENMQRQDLTPMEEARGIAGLLRVGQDVAAISAEIGKSPAWVKRRAQLTKLNALWIESAEKYRLSAAVLELVARYDLVTQDKLHDEYCRDTYNRDNLLNPAGAKWLQHKLAKQMAELRLAPFKLADAVLDPKAGPCTTCQKRTDCQPDLFAEFNEGKKPDARCLDTTCWHRKLTAHTARYEAELRQKHANLVLVSTDYNGVGKGTLKCMDWDEAKPAEKGAVPALMQDGPKAGKLVYVLVRGRGKQQVHAAKNKAEGKPATSMAERRAGLENRRKALAIERLRDEVHNCEVPKVWTVHDALRALIVFGTSERNDSAHASQWTKLEKMLKASEASLKLDALECLRSVFAHRLVIYTAGDAEKRWPEAESIALELAIDLRKLKADADAEIPEPKSWAKK